MRVYNIKNVYIRRTLVVGLIPIGLVMIVACSVWDGLRVFWPELGPYIVNAWYGEA